MKTAALAPLKALQKLVLQVRSEIDMIYAPIFVVQARHDEVIDPDSANIIYEQVESNDKELKWYENSSHVITLSEEKDTLHEDILNFLNKLDWTV